jgi:hypothetical protein
VILQSFPSLQTALISDFQAADCEKIHASWGKPSSLGHFAMVAELPKTF